MLALDGPNLWPSGVYVLGYSEWGLCIRLFKAKYSGRLYFLQMDGPSGAFIELEEIKYETMPYRQPIRNLWGNV